MKFTPGNWKRGKAMGTVVSDTEPNESRDGWKDEHGYYGGYLIAESIGNPADADLLAASKRLLDYCEQFVRAAIDGSDPEAVLVGNAAALVALLRSL